MTDRHAARPVPRKNLLTQQQAWVWSAISAALISCGFLWLLFQGQRIELELAHDALVRAIGLVDPQQSEAILQRFEASQQRFLTTLLGIGGLLLTLSFGIVSAYRDEQRSREASRRSAAALRDNEELLQSLGDNLPQSYVCRYTRLTDWSPRVLYLSAGVRQVHGLDAQQIIDNPRLLTAQIDPELLPAFHAAEQASLHDMSDFIHDFRCRRSDGEERWVQLRARPKRMDDGEVVWDGVVTDITELKLLEAQFLRAQRMEAVGTLAGGLAHDLNNILAPVMMISGLLRSRMTEAGDLRIIDLMENSVQRGAGIIRQLLSFSRGSSGERVQVQLRHLVKETAELLRETFPRDIRIEDNCAADCAEVEGDPAQLHQVLMNLCVNARDAMPKGGVLQLAASNVELGIEATRLHPKARPGNWLLLQVADTGEGMAPEVLQRIFDPFYTTKAPGKGTGLGLSSVMGIVQNHGGFVTVQSTPGKGTHFGVYLPAMLKAARSDNPQDTPTPARGHGETILVVDDEENILETTRKLLEQQGYRVVLARQGEEALRLAQQHGSELRLVITDLMMPVMGGVEFIQRLRSGGARLPIIATTGLGLDDDREALAAAQVSDLLLKPLTPDALLLRIEQKLAA